MHIGFWQLFIVRVSVYVLVVCCHSVLYFPLSYSLPKAVKRRINALKQLQVRCAHIEAKFYEEVHDLERKYAALYQPLFDKVCTIDVFASCGHSCGVRHSTTQRLCVFLAFEFAESLKC